MDDTAKGLLDAGEHHIYGDYLQERSHPLGSLISEKGLNEGRPEVTGSDQFGSFRVPRVAPIGKSPRSWLPDYRFYAVPTRIKQWEAPEHGIQRAGFVYHPEDKTGHIIINDKYHIPVTREELIALGRKRYKKLKLARPLTDLLSKTQVVPKMVDSFAPGTHQAYGDYLQERSHPLGALISEKGLNEGRPEVLYRGEDGTHFQADVSSIGHRGGAVFKGPLHERLRLHAFPVRIKQWEAPEHGIQRAGFVYHPEDKTGHIIINDKYHIPVTREELLALGRKRYKKLKLAREHIKPLLEQGQYEIAADALEEYGHPLASLLRKEGVSKITPKIGDIRDSDGLYPFTSGFQAQKLGSAPAKWMGVVHDTLDAYVRPRRVKRWVNPDIGIRDAGVLYHPTRKSGYVVIDTGKDQPQTWIPVTHEELKNLGHKKLKLAREHIKPLLEQGQYQTTEPDETLRLSRPLTDLLSQTQKAKRLLATRIAKEAGLKLSGLLDARSRDTADVVQVYDHDKDHEGVNYAAAWYGMVSKAPRVRVFHTAPDGPDILYQWKTEQDPEDALAQAPEGTLATSDGRMTYLDHGGQWTPVPGAKAERGHAVVMNGRDAFRERIKGYES